MWQGRHFIVALWMDLKEKQIFKIITCLKPNKYGSMNSFLCFTSKALSTVKLRYLRVIE